MAEPEYYTIGEVLHLLEEDFPEVTISKIRFLETQGLLHPERTASGYRQFSAIDIERLRWILTQQKAHFLPLKVIRDKIEHESPDFRDLDPPDGLGRAGPAELPLEPVEPIGPEPEESVSPQPFLVEARPDVRLDSDELLEASGLQLHQLRDLERLGIVTGSSLGDEVVYDDEALTIARLAVALIDHGIESRHLRMYKIAADREAGFYEQLLVPVLKQRNPDARRHVLEALEDMVRLGEAMREALLRQALRPSLGT